MLFHRFTTLACINSPCLYNLIIVHFCIGKPGWKAKEVTVCKPGDQVDYTEATDIQVCVAIPGTSFMHTYICMYIPDIG